MSDKASIKAIQQRMQQVRHDMGDEVDDLVESAKDITDWRKYVKANPWACMAAAVAVGFLIVPKRASVFRLDDAALRELAHHSKLAVGAQPSSSGGLQRALFSMLASATLRGVTSYLSNRLAQANEPHENGRPF